MPPATPSEASRGMARSSSHVLREVNTSGSGSRRHASTHGRFQLGSIPGYTGFVPGRAAEGVHATTFRESNHGAREAVGKRGYRPITSGGGRDIHEGSFERGSMSCTVGASGDTGPAMVTTGSLFHNPRGHEPRAGAAVPGYAGVIPGKYAGNVFGKRYAMDNVQATQIRHSNYKGEEYTTNWILHAEGDKKHKAHGSGVVGENWLINDAWRSSRRGVTRLAKSSHGDWQLHEPRATHEFLKY